MTSEPIIGPPKWVVLSLVAALAIIHGLQWLQPPRVANWWFEALAVVPGRLWDTGLGMAGGELARATSILTHMFVHADAPHLMMNSMALISFAPEVALRLGVARFLALFVVTGICGAALYIALNAASFAPMIGASGAIFGLLGGLLRIPYRGGRMSLWDAMRSKHVLTSLAVFFVIDALIVNSGAMGQGGIAWEAHLGGLLGGFLLFDLFDPLAR
jgi:membrane associated rhomboid family serine protease